MRIFNKYFWLDLRYKVSAFLNPRQKWLTKKIPKEWCDKPELMRDLLFEFLINYVESENGLQDDQGFWDKEVESGHVSKEYADEILKDDCNLRFAYDYIKKERPKLEAKRDAAYPPRRDLEELFVPVEGTNWLRMVTTEEEDKAYEKVREIESEIDHRDEDVLKIILKYRKIMWT